MVKRIKEKVYHLLRWSEKFTGTDMVYLAHGGFWWVLGKMIEGLIGLGVMMVFARFVSKEIFGAYQYILSLVGLISIFSLGGIDTALIRTVAKGNEKMLIYCFKEKLKWGFIGSAIALIIAGWYWLHQNFELGLACLIVANFLPLINSLPIYLAFWQGKKRFDIQNKYFILYVLLGNSLLISAIILTKNLNWIVLSYFAGFSLVSALFYWLTTKKIVDGQIDQETIPFGKHLTLMSVINTLAAYLDKITLWQLLGPTAVAIYSFAERPVIKMRELLPISTLALPKLSQRNIKEIKKNLLDKFFKLFLAICLVVLVYILLCPVFFKIFFPNYQNSIFYSQILSLTLLVAPFTLLTTSFTAELRKKELYILNFVTPIVKIILFVILIPLMGILGLIAANLVSYAINGCLTLYFFRKI